MELPIRLLSCSFCRSWQEAGETREGERGQLAKVTILAFATRSKKYSQRFSSARGIPSPATTLEPQEHIGEWRKR